MENLDDKLYQDYIKGEKEAFEHLYNKYKNKIQYFIYNIVKDKEKAEDIAQETFIYILKHQKREGYSFKYYIYLIAKCRAINYINMENNRNEINQKYLEKEIRTVGEDVYEIIENKEKQKEIIETINQLDDKYKNAIYLVNIEGLSYKETAKILDQSVQNVKTIIHRGKKEMKRILVKKGYGKMNKISKTLAIVVCVGVIVSGIVHAAKEKIDFSKWGFLKIGENYIDGATILNKKIENEYFTMSLENICGDNSYIILEYIINLKDKAIQEFETIEYNDISGYNVGILNKVTINSDETGINAINKFNKVSNSELQYIQIINVMNMEEKEIDLDIYFDTFYVGNSHLLASNKVYIDKKISAKMSKQGNIKYQAQEQILDSNNKVIIEDIQNTKFETFIRCKYITEGITWKEYQEQNRMSYTSLLLTTEDGQKIQSVMQQNEITGTNKYIKNSYDEYVLAEDFINENDIVKVEKNYLIFLGLQEDIKNLSIIPIRTKLYNDRTTEELNMYKNATWYPVKEGDDRYIAKSTLGGTLIIDNIIVDDDYISFYYELDGFIGNESIVLIRDTSVKEINYAYPVNVFKKDVNSSENKVLFSVNDTPRSGTNVHKMSLKNIDNLEFTLLFGSTAEVIGNSFEIDIPERDNTILKFISLDIIDYENIKEYY